MDSRANSESLNGAIKVLLAVVDPCSHKVDQHIVKHFTVCQKNHTSKDTVKKTRRMDFLLTFKTRGTATCGFTYSGSMKKKQKHPVQQVCGLSSHSSNELG